MDSVCLIVVAHRASDRYPLIIAANRDEDYDRPTLAAHFWEDAPGILGGRDALHGGSWLAISRAGRVGAVTNLRGAAKPDGRSRGFLVRDFVTSGAAPRDYADDVERHKSEYAGFHLIAGDSGGAFVHLADRVREWTPGVHGVSNGPADARWEKIDRAVDHMRSALSIADPLDLAHDLIAFLGVANSDEIERTVFVASDRYGTRSSTAIVVGRTGMPAGQTGMSAGQTGMSGPHEVVFVEQSYARGGVRSGGPGVFRFTRSPSR